MEKHSNTHNALLKENCWWDKVGLSEQLLAKSLPNRSYQKGCVWAHESRADLGPTTILNTWAQRGLDWESVWELFSLLFFFLFLGFFFG